MLCDKNHNTVPSGGVTLHSCHLNSDQPSRRAAHSAELSFDMESSIKVCWSRHNPISEQRVRKEGWPLHLCCQNDYPRVGKLHWGPTWIMVNSIQSECAADHKLPDSFQFYFDDINWRCTSVNFQSMEIISAVIVLMALNTIKCYAYHTK